MPEGEPKDAELAARAASGDDAAFAELVRRHAPRVRALCASVLRDDAEAEDAAQDAFLKAHRSLGRFAGGSSFSTWLHRIATNACLDRLRASARRRAQSLDALLESDSAALGTALREESPAAALESRDLVARLLERLTPEQRVALTLRELEGLSYEEIASALSCSLDAVKARLKRARAELLDLARHFSGPGAV